MIKLEFWLEPMLSVTMKQKSNGEVAATFNYVVLNPDKKSFLKTNSFTLSQKDIEKFKEKKDFEIKGILVKFVPDNNDSGDTSIDIYHNGETISFWDYDLTQIEKAIKIVEKGEF